MMATPNDRDRARRMRLMQEAVDEQLSPRQTQELRRRLELEPDAQTDYDRLRQVDEMLRTAPHERAPQQLAVKLMARLAESLHMENLSRTAGLALALALTLVTAVLLPLLAGIGWLILSTIGNSAALSAALGQLAGLLAMLMNGLEGLVQAARGVLEAYPATPAALILIPVSLFGLWRLRSTQRNK
ncbi:hypothetical protein FBR02_09815 [Anaerolineae bacterium CFX9]|nr:hypothetical protein [Anaerolineae bacterium CFX9]